MFTMANMFGPQRDGPGGHPNYMNQFLQNRPDFFQNHPRALEFLQGHPGQQPGGPMQTPPIMAPGQMPPNLPPPVGVQPPINFQPGQGPFSGGGVGTNPVVGGGLNGLPIPSGPGGLAAPNGNPMFPNAQQGNTSPLASALMANKYGMMG